MKILTQSRVLTALTTLEKPVLVVLLAFSVVANVVMSARVRTPKTPPADGLVIGTQAPPLTLQSLNGTVLTVDYANAPEGTGL
jgi:hypothetical protein